VALPFGMVLSRLVERSVQGEMKGEPIMDDRPQGVMCRITAPLEGGL
jgi:two-component sensor histidine kinase